MVLGLALVVAVSCVPVQAAEQKSTWTVFKNGAKILLGSLFVFNNSIKVVIDAATFDKDAALQRAEEQHQSEIAQAQNRGGDDLNARLTMIDFWDAVRKANIQDRGTFGVWKLVWTAAGIALIYSGYQGLNQEEEPAKA